MTNDRRYVTTFGKRVQRKKTFSKKTKGFPLNEKRKGNVLSGKHLCSILSSLDLFLKGHLKRLLTRDKTFSQIFLRVDPSYH